MTRLGFLALAATLTGCATTAPPPSPTTPTAAAGTDDPITRTNETRPVSRPPTILLFVRHAEKASDGTRDPALLPAGVERADCLARIARQLDVTHAFATDLQRTQQTLQPLADAHQLAIEVTPASQTDALLAKLQALPPGSIAIVSGHSNTLPAIVSAFGTALPELDARGNIPEHEHDRLVELVVSDSGTPATLLNLRYCAASAAP